jgi:hypothetical protein
MIDNNQLQDLRPSIASEPSAFVLFLLEAEYRVCGQTRTTYSVLYPLPLALTARFAYSDPLVAKLSKIEGIKMSKTTETNFLKSSRNCLL